MGDNRGFLLDIRCDLDVGLVHGRRTTGARAQIASGPCGASCKIASQDWQGCTGNPAPPPWNDRACVPFCPHLRTSETKADQDEQVYCTNLVEDRPSFRGTLYYYSWYCCYCYDYYYCCCCYYYSYSHSHSHSSCYSCYSCHCYCYCYSCCCYC